MPVLGSCSLGIPRGSADGVDVGHGAPCSLLGSQESPESPSLVSRPQQLVAQPQLRHRLSPPALPMHTRTGHRPICSTLLPQSLRFYSFKVSPCTKQSLRILQWWSMQGSQSRSAQPHRLMCDKPPQPPSAPSLEGCTNSIPTGILRSQCLGLEKGAA